MSLQHYLRKAYEAALLSSDDMTSTVRDITGTLQRDGENLVLVYGGSFNPPHRGHLDILSALLHPKLAALAVVILPSEDFHLRHKMTNSHPGFFLRQKRRADIWEALPQVPRDKVWVWRSTWYPFEPFTEALVRLTRQDGFKLVLSHVIGPDILNTGDPLSMDIPCALPRMLVTNRGRNVSGQFLSDGRPVRWAGFKDWICYEGKAGYGGACQLRLDVHSILTQRIADLLGDSKPDSPDLVLWMCTGLDDNNPDKRGYYLQYTEPVAGLSSTSFRRNWAQSCHPNEEALNQLSTKDLLGLLSAILPIDTSSNGGSQKDAQLGKADHVS